MARAGTYKGRHYTEWTEEVRNLKRKERLAEAEELLLGLISATESERKKEGPDWSLPPGYTRNLAIIYRKQHRYQDEIDVLTRYMQVDQGHFTMFSDRRRKAQLLLGKTDAVAEQSTDVRPQKTDAVAEQSTDVKPQKAVAGASESGCALMLVLIASPVIVILIAIVIS